MKTVSLVGVAIIACPVGFPQRTFRAKLALVGKLYDEGEAIEFSEVAFSLEGLETWLAISGIEFEQDFENPRGAIHFQLPEAITINLFEDLRIEFKFGLSFPTVSFPITKASVSQTVSAFFICQGKHPLDEFLTLASKLRNFIALGLDQAISVKEVAGYVEGLQTNRTPHNPPVKIYGQFLHGMESSAEIRWHRKFFLYRDIEDRCEEILQNWFRKYGDLESAFNLFFGSKFGGLDYLDVRFLWLVQGVEVLHRRSFDGKEMPEQEFRSLRRLLLKFCPDDKKEFLRRKLSYANEIPLSQRIRSWAEPFSEYLGGEGMLDDFVKKVVATRNELTHRNNQRNSVTGAIEELWVLNGKLETLFQLYIIGLAGIGYTEIMNDKAEIIRRLSA